MAARRRVVEIAWFRLLALLIAVTLGACVSAPPGAFTTRTSLPARVEWRQGGRTFASPAVFQTGAGDALRLVVADSRTELMLVRTQGEWSAIGPLAGRAWRGPMNTAPAVVEGWLSLAEAFEGASYAPGGDSEVRNSRFSVRYEKDGPRLRSLEMVAIATGARFRVEFAP